MSEETQILSPPCAGARSPTANPSRDGGKLFWQVTGMAVAAAAGGLAGFVLAKYVLIGKGAAAVPWVLGAKSGGEGALAATGTVSASTWGGKLSSVFRSLADQGLPLIGGLAGGAVGGGAAGAGLAGRKVAAARQQLQEQLDKTAARLRAETVQLRESLGAAEARISELRGATRPAGDPLEDIHGIGKVYADRLRAAGIGTFAALAAETAERIREIIGRGSPLSNDHIRTWIEQARVLAGPA